MGDPLALVLSSFGCDDLLLRLPPPLLELVVANYYYLSLSMPFGSCSPGVGIICLCISVHAGEQTWSCLHTLQLCYFRELLILCFTSELWWLFLFSKRYDWESGEVTQKFLENTHCEIIIITEVEMSSFWSTVSMSLVPHNHKGCSCPSLQSFHCCVCYRNWDNYDRAELVSLLFWTSLFVTILITISSPRLWNCKITAIFIFPFAAGSWKVPFMAFPWNSFINTLSFYISESRSTSISSAVYRMLLCPGFHRPSYTPMS